MTAIQTERLLLRPFTLDDIDDCHRTIYADAEVMRFLPGGKPAPRERTERAVRRYVNGWADSGFSLWSVIYQQTGEFIGEGGLMVVPGSDKIEVAYALARPYWGAGLATEIGRAALRFGFDHLKLTEIIGVVVPEHDASAHVLEKLGMSYQGLTTEFYEGTLLKLYQMTVVAFTPSDDPYVLKGAP